MFLWFENLTMTQAKTYFIISFKRCEINKSKMEEHKNEVEIYYT